MQAGHPYDAVMNDYTMEEIVVHYETLELSRIRKMKQDTITMFNASRAMGKDLSKFLHNLDNVLEPKKDNSLFKFFKGLTELK